MKIPKILRWIVLLEAAGMLLAQNRIAAPIEANRRAILSGHRHPRAQAQYDRGAVDGSLPISYATIHFRPVASLDLFLAELQSPSSPNYHRYLTPEQFGDRFGFSNDDMAKTAAWLRSEGLTVHDLARGRNWITFSGTARQVGRAFRTELHRYRVDGKLHFAAATEPSVPVALENLVSGIGGLDDFVPESLIRKATALPLLTEVDGRHYLAPDDLATIYNIKPLYDAGIDGTGQKIAVIGRSAIDLTDIRVFRRIFNLRPNDPQLMLIGADPGKTDDEPEADLDLEWAGAVARNATIVYVYARDLSVAAQQAVDQNVAPVMTFSFGGCELFAESYLRGVAQQANAQGITWLAGSGDWGAATCDHQFAPTPQASRGPIATFPASLPEITAVGGTEFNEGSGNYWDATNSVNGASARSYIPEKPWNDSANGGLWAGGGGASVLFSKPYWQSGPGVPDDKARDLPDISLAASGRNGYLIVARGVPHVVQGTSASSPAFAGIVALLNQYQKSNRGQGNINPVLYRMAQSNPDAFHDVTEGDIKVPCAQGSPGCVNGLMGPSAGPNYDLATGLGSVDAYRLVTEWNPGKTSTTSVTATRDELGLAGSVKVTVTVSGASGSPVPTGAVTLIATGNIVISRELEASGVAVLSVESYRIAAGNNTVTAFYGGDGVYGSSSARISLAFEYSPSAAVVIVSSNPNPVVSTGTIWPYALTIAERAGVAATITEFSVDGMKQTLPGVLGTTSLPANGTLTVALRGFGITGPTSFTFLFKGIDANGQSWSQELSLPFLAGSPLLAPVISITATPSNIQQDPQANPACAWSIPLVIQEKSGFSAQLTALTVSSVDYSADIHRLFGTTRLAPFGTLRATVCRDRSSALGIQATRVTAASEIGTMISATTSVTLAAAPAATTSMSLAPKAIVIPVPNSSQNGRATVNLSFGAGTPAWKATVLPVSAGPEWLSVSPLSGNGPATFTLDAASAGLSHGVYSSKLVISSNDTSPQVLEIPVTLVVGVSETTAIGGVTNAASSKIALAPGMLMSVYGINLAPSTAVASRQPLPLTLAGVSATVNGVTAPLRFVSPGQLNIQIPYETGSGTAVLGVNNNGQVASFPMEVANAAPGIFAGADNLLVPNASGKRGEILLAFITGDGDLTPTLATGATPSPATVLARLPKPRLPVTLTVGGVKADLAFVGVPNGLIGVTQINFTVPSGAPFGLQPVVVTVGGVDSPPVNLNIIAQ